MIPGDVVIALPSSGVHSNGFSLVRKVFDMEHSLQWKTPRPELGGKSAGETLLVPTKIYVKPMLALLDRIRVKGISHITGGGFFENIPRAIPDGLGARIQKARSGCCRFLSSLPRRGPSRSGTCSTPSTWVWG